MRVSCDKVLPQLYYNIVDVESFVKMQKFVACDIDIKDENYDDNRLGLICYKINNSKTNSDGTFRTRHREYFHLPNIIYEITYSSSIN